MEETETVMFWHKKKKTWGNEFLVLGAFAAVVIAGFFYAVCAVILTAHPGALSRGPLAVQPVAPTPAEYEQQARDVMQPFLSQATVMTVGQIDAAGPEFYDLVTKTQDRLLRLRVPKDLRDSHLSFVLLLDQWKRALDGSKPDRAVVLDKTRSVVAANSWLQ